MTEIAQTPAPSADLASSGRESDNPLVRAVGSIPLPLGAKLLIGFAVVGALLAIGYGLGFVALGQSNSRGQQLRRLQQQAAYEQLLLTEARQLQDALDFRLRYASPQQKAGVDASNGIAWNNLCADAGIPDGCVNPSGGGPSAPKSLTLGTLAPGLFYRLRFDQPSFLGGGSHTQSALVQADSWVHSFAGDLNALTARTRARTDALVAADHSSFVDSRDLLLGVGAGSLALAVVLALVLSGSVVVPLRRTRERLAAIAAGDFSSRLEVANRDEIGGLVSDVNTMSDELEDVRRELELASEHKSRFVTNMSHELRTPLNAIIGFSDVLHEQMFGELNERQLAYVDDIREAGRHQLSLINELLDLAKIEAGRMDLVLSQVSIPEVLRAAVSLQAERASRGGIDLAWTAEPEEITVTADEKRIRQVVFNLVSNAIKFTPPQGRINISARANERQVEVAVSDTGPGILPEQLETIFEEFEQTAEGREVEGTGLGLPLSRKLVELHGGRLWAESTTGQGSAFRFTLPLEHDPTLAANP